MSEHWLYQAAGKARQTTTDGLRQLYRSGHIDAHSLVCREGSTHWVAYGQVRVDEPALGEPRPVMEPPPMDPVPPRMPQMPTLVVQDDGWQDTTPRPWRRYFARIIDITVLSAALGLVLGIALFAASPALYEKLFLGEVAQNRVTEAMLSTLLVVPVLMLLIGLFGTTPGKWFMGVRITRRDGQPIGLGAALAREFDVYVRGFALGVPIISLFTLIAGYKTLTSDGVASWDRNKPWVVTYRPDGTKQVLLVIVGLVFWAAVFAAINAME